MSHSDGRSGMLPCSLLIQVVQLVEIFDNGNDDDDDNQMMMMMIIKMMMIKHGVFFCFLFCFKDIQFSSVI